MKFIHDSIKYFAKMYPDQCAIIYKDKSFSYAKIWNRILLIANWLSNRISKSSRIVICLENRLETVYSLYAISAAGLISVPLEQGIHEKNLLYILNDCDVETVITSKTQLNKFNRIKDKVNLKNIILCGSDQISCSGNLSTFFFNDIFENSTIKTPLNLRYHRATDTVCILYTTGTTGPKKGVMLSHQNLLSATKNINQFIQIGSWAVESLPMPLSHSFGFARLRCVLDVGGTVILENGLLRPERVLNNMRLHKANAISTVPAGFSILLDYYKEEFEEIGPQIRYIEIGSAFMRQNHKDMLMKLCPKARICMHYGLTEASRSTFIEFHPEKDKLRTVGKPSPNVGIKIIDEDGNTLGVNETGEIMVKGGMVMKGYWNKEEMTNVCLTDGWLHTSDLGMIDSDGYVHLLGRKDEIINIGGLKVAPGEVEEVLLKNDGIVEVAVVGLKSTDGISDKTIKAFIVTNDNSLSFEEIEKYCLENLEPYKVPTQFEIVDSLPKTSSGKIQRHLLIEENSKGTTH